jgi:YHS domain-containing protein
LVTTQSALAARDCGAVVTHVGAVELRNVAEPVDLYDVHVASGARDVGIDPVCKMRVPTKGAAAVTLDWAGSAHHFCGLPCLSRFAADPLAFLPG